MTTSAVRSCCEVHGHVDRDEPFVRGVKVTWCGDQTDLDVHCRVRLGLYSHNVVILDEELRRRLEEAR